MKISYNWLKKYIYTSVDIKLICNLLTDIGFNVEKLKKISFSEKKKEKFIICKIIKSQRIVKYFFILKKKKYKKIYNIIYNFFFKKKYSSLKEDYLIELNIPPNKGDVMSHYGIARDLNIALKYRGFLSKIRDLPPVSLFKKDFDFQNLKIKHNKKCIRYTYTTICNINVYDSPKWLKQYLNIIGCNTRNNILDIENFIMYELGQPIKIFDLDKIIDLFLKIKFSKKKLKFKLNDNKDIFLNEKDLVLFNYQNPICIAGILVNQDFVVNKQTKNLFIESAYYASESIYRTAKKYHLKNDSSIRFERGIDPNLIIYALKRAALLIKEISGGKITSNVIDIYPNKINNIEIFLRYKRLYNIVGFNINKKKIKEILFLLEISILFENFNGLKIKVPLYRKDITREIDVIEEILRIYGYNNFCFKHEIFLKQINLNKNLKIENMISNQLNSHGFYETLNISLNKKKYINYFNNNLYKKINILNSYNKDLSILRFSLLFGILENISYNLNRNLNNLKLFEWGKKYFFYKKNIIENKTLGIIISYEIKKNYNIFFYFKGILEQLIIRCGIKFFNQKIYKDSILENGVSFSYKNYIFCIIGYVKNKILIEFEILNKILYADINWDLINILFKKNDKTIYKKIDPLYRRDISLLIENNISFEEIKKISFSEKKIIKICLLDEYKSQNLPFGKKSYTISFFFKDKNNNLTDALIENTINSLKLKFIKKLKAKIR
ncbi:phenylalanine--tRNA ligase subunit beta [Candidatus Karelsulcia muelleri]|uniref:phenylalanine--tRNA ligase subunit beta n=1 Tax=Candidatus Karelsulcia muelleri TaxID=336810 RepID=UPI000B92C26C|nr:phenylalanine--tRNA ligase subunit beta [Candidatus Karelsulcia muelleri]ASS46812.1 Phenylalanine--tRNA ligase beta subunit [Candidatus Karelsulcia muelleri]